MSDVTQILQSVRRGDNRALEDLLPLIYDALKKLAAARMAHEAAGHTLQPTVLVHEAWLQLVKDEDRNWENRIHFFQSASQAMRRILIDHARRKFALKRGGKQEHLNIADMDYPVASPDEKVLLVDSALEELEKIHPERARIVLMKFFGGMTNEEVAAALGVGKRTVCRHWECARLWLFNKLNGEE